MTTGTEPSRRRRLIGISPIADSSRRAAHRVAIVAVALSVVYCSTALAEATPVPIEELPAEGFEYSEYGEIAVGPEGNIWTFQNETFFSPSFGLIDRITPAGLSVGAFELAGSHEPEYGSRVSALTLGPDGNMWFTNDEPDAHGHDRIGRITPAGAVTELPIVRSAWAESLSPWEPDPNLYFAFEEPDYWMGPMDLTAAPDGAIWFTESLPDESGHTAIERVGPRGELKEYPIPTGYQPGVPIGSMPTSIAPGPAGTIWFTDRGNDMTGHNLIGKVGLDGVITEYPIPTRGGWSTSIAMGSDDAMWFTEPGVSKIGRINQSGEVSEYSAPSVSTTLHGIIAGPDGDMWFATHEGFGRISPQGDVTLFSARFAGGSPRSLAADQNGNIWFTDTNGVQYTTAEYMFVGKFHVPLTPVNTVLPAVSGGVYPGEPLGISPGAWEYTPTSISYQWQACDELGRGCEDIPGETDARYVIGSADIGRTLRAVVTAGNIAGTVSVASAPSTVIARRTGPPVPPIVKPMPATPVVGSTMTWRFASRHGRTSVKSLIVHNVPSGAVIEVACQAKACANRGPGRKVSRFTRCSDAKCTARRVANRSGMLNVTPFFEGISFKAGARVSIDVVESGVIGRSFNYTMRRRGTPAVQLSCLAAGSFTVGISC